MAAEYLTDFKPKRVVLGFGTHNLFTLSGSLCNAKLREDAHFNRRKNENPSNVVFLDIWQFAFILNMWFTYFFHFRHHCSDHQYISLFRITISYKLSLVLCH